MKYSRRDRAEAIEALMTCAASWWDRRFDMYTSDVTRPGPVRDLCKAAWAEVYSQRPSARDSMEDTYHAAASLLASNRRLP